MDMNVYNVLGVIGIMGVYVWLKYRIYKMEYNNNKNKKDIVIKRGNEWEYEE